MIVTVTPNPSVDRTIEVSELVRGAVLRASAAWAEPGGKGVNVARALAANGAKAIAVLPTGGAEGLQLAALLAAEGVEVVEVPLAGSTRANVTVVEPDGTTTKLNEPGPDLSPAEGADITEAVVAAAAGARWVVACGSLPPGLPCSYYADLVHRLAGREVRVAVDTSGAALSAAVAAGPALVKPNRDELAEATGRPLHTLGDAVAAARELLRRGAGMVLASLGRDGALLVDADAVIHGEAPVTEPRSTVGAGDAALAGFLFAGAAGPAALVSAVAWGAAATRMPGSRAPEPADIDIGAVRIRTDPDLNRLLEGRH